MKDNISEEINALPPLRVIIERYNLTAKKTLGQNFLRDLNLTSKIVKTADLAASLKNHPVIEIGPGPGGLTRALLLQGVSSLYAVEKDHRFVDVLAPLEKISGKKFTLLEEDALYFDSVSHVSKIHKIPPVIVANLPYNIATTLLIKWLFKGDKIASMTLMFQKEVAERITARPHTKSYGRLSVLSNWCCQTKLAFTLPPQAFIPPPKVSSALVQLTPKTREDFYLLPYLETITKAAFGQRRKMLRSSLKKLSEIFPALNLETFFNATNIAPNARAEELEIESFHKMALFLAENYKVNEFYKTPMER